MIIVFEKIRRQKEFPLKPLGKGLGVRHDVL